MLVWHNKGTLLSLSFWRCIWFLWWNYWFHDSGMRSIMSVMEVMRKREKLTTVTWWELFCFQQSLIANQIILQKMNLQISCVFYAMPESNWQWYFIYNHLFVFRFINLAIRWFKCYTRQPWTIYSTPYKLATLLSIKLDLLIRSSVSSQGLPLLYLYFNMDICPSCLLLYW